MKTAIEYLKNAMSVKYCGKTRFDFLDPEEVTLVEKAMESYAKQWSKEKDKRIAELEEALRELHTNTFYQLSPKDNREGYQRYDLFDKVEKALNSQSTLHGKQE